ncbi:MAG: hypothetical protein RL885_15990 [Planctomycetota bacterium]
MSKVEQKKAADRKKVEDKIFQRLVKGKQKDHVTLVLHDGRVVDGMIIFNELKRVGRLINVNKEISIDYSVEEVREVRF